MGRRKEVYVEIDLSNFDDEDLLDELRARRKGTSFDDGTGDWLERLRWLLMHRQVQTALAMVETELWPARNAAARELAVQGMTRQ